MGHSMEMSQHPQVVEPRNSSGDGPDEDRPRRSENKRKRFHPFRAVRNIFSRKAKRQGSEDDQGSSKKSRSTSELFRVPNDVPQFPGLAPPYAVGLSVSHDSIFTPEHGNGQEDIQGSSLSVQHVALKGFKDELFTRVRARRDSDDDDDVGLPHSPCTSPTTADVLAQGLKDKSSKSRSTCSASSLLSMGSSENDEDLMGPSRLSYLDGRFADFDAEQDAAQPVPLNHNAALHKIAVRPKRTHGLPHHRKLQQMAASAVRLTLPATPEVTEDQGKLSSLASTSSSSSSPPVKEDLTTTFDTEKNTGPSVEEVGEQEMDALKEDAVMTPDFLETTLKVSEIPSIEEEPSSLHQEREMHISKGKSAAAELKLRHEIKEFSRRQNEKREGALVDLSPLADGEESFKIADVKESMKSLESTISVGEEQSKNDAKLKTPDGPKENETENMESWCVIELGQTQESTKEPPSTIAETERLQDQVQKTVINVTDVNVCSDCADDDALKNQSVERPVPNLHSMGKMDQTELSANEEKHSIPINSSVVQNNSMTEKKGEATVQKDQPTMQLHSNAVPEKRKSIPLQSEQSLGTPTSTIESKSDQNTVAERPKVVLRRHLSNRVVSETQEVQKDFRASADVTSSTNFSDIMKHRRSLVDSDSTPEGIKNLSNRSVYEEGSGKTSSAISAGNRVSVEIIPFNQRSKNSSSLSTSPSTTFAQEKMISPDGPEEAASEDPNPSDTSSQGISEGTGPQKQDRMQYPIRFRIRKGSRSFSEVKESANNRVDDFENRFSDPKPLLRPKPLTSPKEEAAGDGNATPEFMRIQLRSSKEELDKSEPPTSSPQATPQWEVKILQRQRSGPSSLPVYAAECKTADAKTPEINGNTEIKPQFEKKTSDPKSKTVSVSNENINKDSVAETTKKEEMNSKENNNFPTERTALTANVTNNDSPAKVPDSPKSTNQEPELFRVFARRSIKQKNTEKSTEVQTGKTETAGKPGQVEKAPRVIESAGHQTQKPQQSQQKPEVKLTETPKKQEMKIGTGEAARKIDTASKEVLRKPEAVEMKIASDETIRKYEPQTKVIPTTKKVDNNNALDSTALRRNFAKSWISQEVKQVETSAIHRRNSAPPEPKMAEKENVHSRDPTQVTVSIQPQRPTIPLTRNDSGSKLTLNNNKDSLGGGNMPAWMQLAQQRREQREQKERMLYASTGSSSFVLEPNSRPSRNSKVLDMVNNFQKLQTT